MPEQTADRRSPSGNLSESLIVPFGQSWKYTAWLYAVARNLFYNHQKKAKQEVLSEDMPDAGPTKDILDQILQEEKLKNLYDGIRKLENRKQEVLQLQYFAHLSQKEIAAVLHLTPEHVRILAYRARKELKALMDKEYQEDRT